MEKREVRNGFDEVNFTNLLSVSDVFKDDQTCRNYLEKVRWPGKRICPHCGSDSTCKFKDGKTYKCYRCRKQFTVTKGTIFERTHVPLRKWFLAFYIMTSHKKGISSCQLAKDIGVTQKTAWFMLHRIREAIRTKSFKKPLEGTIEADETYIGGKNRNRHFGKRKRGRGATGKTAVFGMVERKSGEVRSKPIKSADSETLQTAIRENVRPKSRLFTDDWLAYRALSKDYLHEIVCHSYKQYVRGEVHTNTLEGFWSHLKRGILGIYHHVSPKHLARYLDEFGHRFNTRTQKEAPRFEAALANCEGRLTYAQLIR